jgi:hypothetical protein
VEKGTPEEAVFTASAQPRPRAPAAVALAAITFLAVALLARETTPSVGLPIASVTAQASSAAAATSSVGPTVTPTSLRTSGAPSRNPTVTPHPTFVAVPAEAGATRLVPAGPTPIRVTITFPDGWEKADAGLYVKPNGAAPVGMSIGAWSIQHVNLFPCRWATRAFADELYAPTAEGQAEALAAWWGQDPNAPFSSNSEIAPIASKRRPATIGGYPAWYLEVLIPSVFDFTKCDGGQLVLWETANGDVRYGLGPGELDRLWVVDVHGESIVIDAALPLMASAADETELQAVVHSIVIEP